MDLYLYISCISIAYLNFKKDSFKILNIKYISPYVCICISCIFYVGNNAMWFYFPEIQNWITYLFVNYLSSPCEFSTMSPCLCITAACCDSPASGPLPRHTEDPGPVPVRSRARVLTSDGLYHSNLQLRIKMIWGWKAVIFHLVQLLVLQCSDCQKIYTKIFNFQYTVQCVGFAIAMYLPIVQLFSLFHTHIANHIIAFVF